MVNLKLDLHTGLKMEQEVELPSSQYRLCYRRAFQDWRVRNERTQELYHVENIAENSDINIHWVDHHSHIFHMGEGFIDKDYTLHLYDANTPKEKKLKSRG